MIEPRPYQTPAIQALANSRLGYLEARAGSGKTIMAALACKLIQVRFARSIKVVWLAPTIEIREQGRAAFEAVGFDGEVDCRCWQGLERVPECDVLIIDECHQVASLEYRALLRTTLERRDGKWIRRCITLGLTATPAREDGQSIEPIIGPCIYRIDPQDIKAAGGVLPCEVRIIENGQERESEFDVKADAEKLYNSRLQWADRQNGSEENWKRCLYRAAVKRCVLESSARDDLIVSLVAYHVGEVVIVLVDQIEHGKRLVQRMPDAVMFHSGMRGRAKAMEDLRAGRIPVVVATSLLEQGFDAPVASVLILAGTGKSWRKTIQATGRVLRPAEGKERGIVYDFADQGHGMLMAQHWKRRMHYDKIGYSVRKYFLPE